MAWVVTSESWKKMVSCEVHTHVGLALSVFSGCWGCQPHTPFTKCKSTTFNDNILVNCVQRVVALNYLTPSHIILTSFFLHNCIHSIPTQQCMYWCKTFNLDSEHFVFEKSVYSNDSPLNCLQSWNQPNIARKNGGPPSISRVQSSAGSIPDSYDIYRYL